MAENQPLMKRQSKSDQLKQDFVRRAQKSKCAASVDELFKDKDAAAVGRLKQEMFEKIYETMGEEMEPEEIARALVVRNEKFGQKVTVFLTIITLGIFLLIRPRDDDMVLVLTTQGRVVKLKVERTPCCPTGPNQVLFVFLKYMAMLFAILVMPTLVHMVVTGHSVEEELHQLHLDTDGFCNLPAFVRRNYIVSAFTLAVFLFWMCSLMPHDYRDRHRRRHMAREVAVGQFTLTGFSCRRRSTFRLFFGKYPSQLMLDLVGSLDVGRAAGTIHPGDLSATPRMNPGAIIVGLTLFLSCVTGLDTFFAWLDRSIALDHFAKMQQFCISAPNIAGQCTQDHCETWAVKKHIGVSTTFCSQVSWVTDAMECTKYKKDAPCCGGCAHGGFMSAMDEGVLATFKTMVSLVADTGTILFTLLAARYALSLATATDNIDVLIKRRSRSSFQTEIANFEFTVPLALNFMEEVFSSAMAHSMQSASEGRRMREQTADTCDGPASKWCGVKNFEIDDDLADWEEFFEKDLMAPPDTRWTSKVKVPRRCLGIPKEEEVLAAWVELPLLPPPMTFFEFMTGGLWRALLPFGKTRHAVIITEQRIFYVRHRRPSLPIGCLGTDLRIDVFRHDHDVVYGRMDRTKLSFINRLVHQKLLFENFLPGKIQLQTKFGALELTRQHGDALDVYHLISQLSKNTAGFISKEAVEKAGVDWAMCQEDVESHLKQKSGRIWEVKPQPDDVVEPKPDIYLSDGKNELVVFYLTLKDLGSTFGGRYTNTDIVVTTGRIFFWNRQVYKKFDCQALTCWLTCWMGCLNPLFAARNLPNSMSFMTLPTMQSFSTDLSVDSPSWLIPHHTPLKIPCCESLCLKLTRKVSCDSRPIGHINWGICPKRSAASAHLQLMWRLKQSSHAEEDMMLLYTIKPHVMEELPETDAEDILNGLGFVTDQDAEAGRVLKGHDDRVEALRKIMSVVQDACHALSDKMDDLI